MQDNVEIASHAAPAPRLARKGPFSGEDFARAIRRGEVDGWDGLRIAGEVNLKGVELESPLAMRGTIFTGPVDFGQAQFKRGVALTGCRFEQKLILSDARVEGSLKLDEAVIGPGSEKAQGGDAGRGDSPEDEAREWARVRWASQRRWRREVRGLGDEQQTPAEFDNLRVEGSLSMMRAEVAGRLSCNHSEIKSDFRLDGARVRGDLSLRHAALGALLTDAREMYKGAVADAAGLPEEPCRIDGKLDLTSASIAGDVHLVGITIGGELTMQATNIRGSLRCRPGNNLPNQVRGGVSLLVASIKGIVDFSGTWIGVRAYLSGAKLENALSFTGVNINRGDLSLEDASIGGMLLLRAVRREKKLLRCKIGRSAWLLGVTVAGSLDASGARIGGMLMLQNANIGQNFLAKTLEGFRTQINGGLHLNGARVRGGVELGGAILRGDFDLDGASIAGDFIVGPGVNDDDAEWRLVRSQVEGLLHAESAIIGKRVVLAGLTVGRADPAPDAAVAKDRGVTFTGARVGGEFSLSCEDVMKEFLQAKMADSEDREIALRAAPKLSEEGRRERTTISGNLRLNRAQLLGGVLLDGAVVEGEIDVRDANVRASINCRPLPPGDGQPALRACAERADFETLDMTGDMNLTGLEIGRGQAGAGDLVLRDAKIRGRLELSPAEDAQGVAQDAACTFIAGKLHLDAAEISHVVLSGRNFGDETPARRLAVREWLADRWRRFDSLLLLIFEGGRAETRKEVRFGLERATIGRLEIKEPLPGTIDLSNLKVDRWDLPEDRSSYKKMLESSYPFKKSNYLAVENVLRNAGDDEKADEAHVCMRRRDRRSTKSRWKILLDLFLDLSIKYGTTSKRIVCAMLLLFALSVLLFRDPNHLEYGIAPTAQVPHAEISPAPANWNLGDAVLFAARLNIPIISLGGDEKIGPRGTGLKAYAMAVTAANWVMWPLLIASASGFIRKRN